MNEEFWKNRKVFITGHTGFKGGWLSLFLHNLGADIAGYSLAPAAEPSLFSVAKIGGLMKSFIGDVRDLARLSEAMADFKPEIVIHMAAQPLVRQSYDDPIETYSTNVMGTVNLLEAVRQTTSVKAVVNVTTDKCYENREWPWGYREIDPLGGYDPYSSSKACSEMVSAAYRSSFFSADSSNLAPAVATARAGNVIGGGDWSQDRLVPDLVRAIAGGSKLSIRNPGAIRPWQHVMDPLRGYLILAELLFTKGNEFAEGWNFGPNSDEARPVGWVVEKLQEYWGKTEQWVMQQGVQPHEANLLMLDTSKSRSRLDWVPKWPLEVALEQVVDWYKSWLNGEDMQVKTLQQVVLYNHWSS